MDYMSRLCSLGNSSTASESNDPRGTVGPSYRGRPDFFLCPLYFFLFSLFSACLLSLFLCHISILLFLCASVWENTSA